MKQIKEYLLSQTGTPYQFHLSNTAIGLSCQLVNRTVVLCFEEDGEARPGSYRTFQVFYSYQDIPDNAIYCGTVVETIESLSSKTNQQHTLHIYELK